jgi:hypothetical protein
VSDAASTESNGEVDFDSRELCADGVCTGVIGDDGRCRVCGKSAGEAAEPDADADNHDAPVAEFRALDGAEAFDEDRKLCPDGACVGIMGADGRCKVCGAVA